MSSKSIRALLVSMLVITVALFVTQGYWFKKAFDLSETQFEDKLNIALRSVADQLLILNNDSTSRIAPIEKLSSNEFLVKTHCYLNIGELDSLIKREFSSREMTFEYDYLILESESDEIVLGNTVPYFMKGINSSCMGRDDFEGKSDFKIRLNNKTTYLANSMGIWMYSSFTLLAIITVFTFITVVILKGKKLARFKKDFVNNMTHELKTPIANISVASDALRNKSKTMEPEKLAKYADIIYKENVRLHGLVDRVLQISALEKQSESLFFEKLDLHDTLNEVVSNFEPLIQDRAGSIVLNLEATQAIVKADKTHLANVVYNLIENAIKYSKEAPEIVLKTSNKKGGITLEVSDSGIGMSSENQHKIFDQFFRAETGNLHNTKGFGLGLSYVKLIVEKHLGSISFTSSEGLGSTFNIFLPI